MDTRVLRYFLTVAHEGTFSKAAHALHITQPTLSRQIADLEKQLGCSLLERDKRGVKLTPEGMTLRRRAREIIALIETTETEIGAENNSIAGDIRIGAGETDAMEHVSRIMIEMRNDHPEVNFHLISGNGEDIEERLEKGTVDFALFVDEFPHHAYEHVTIPNANHYVAFMRSDCPLAQLDAVRPEDLAGQHIIVPMHHNYPTAIDSIIDVAVKDADIAASCNLATNALYMVRAGFGIALTLNDLGNAMGPEVVSRPLDPPYVVDVHIA